VITLALSLLASAVAAQPGGVPVYRWKDPDGRWHTARELEGVPEEYREQARQDFEERAQRRGTNPPQRTIIKDKDTCDPVLTTGLRYHVTKPTEASDASRPPTTTRSFGSETGLRMHVSRTTREYDKLLSWIMGLAPRIHPSFGRVTSVDLLVYPNTNAFSEALRAVGQPKASRFDAFALRGVIYVNHEKMRCLGNRTELIAHEFAHVLGHVSAPIWVAEGFAEWFARQVAVLGGRPTTDEAEWTPLTRTDPARIPRLKDLEAVSAMGKAEVLDKYGMPVVYAVGTRAVALLIDRHGLDALLGYYARLASFSHEAAFRTAFHRSIDDLQREFDERLAEARSKVSSGRK
jgi:hypothetical protein